MEALLSELQLSEFAAGLQEEGFLAPEDLAELGDDDVKELGKDVGMKRGHVIRFARWVREQRGGGGAAPPPPPPPPPPLPPPDAAAHALSPPHSPLPPPPAEEEAVAARDAAEEEEEVAVVAVVETAEGHAGLEPGSTGGDMLASACHYCEVAHDPKSGVDEAPRLAVRWCAGGCGWICTECVAVHTQHSGLFSGHNLLAEPP